ncbi:methyltransferase domain-containing protein [Denitratisoma sp. agr-D3]
MPIEGFRDWLTTPQGQYVLHWELQRHEQLLADVFGFNAVQIGLPEIDYLHGNRMPFRFRCGNSDYALATPAEEVRADFHHLPFATNSVDLVVLPHALEFDPNPHQILREVERILVPEGQVVITCFNPFSLWGVRRAFKRQPQPAPWAGRYISVPRLKDWFALLGFETRAGAFGCYAPPLEQPHWLHRFRFMESAGDRWWPYAGAVYIMQAIKRQHGMRLIMPQWRDRLARAKALVSVAQKTNPLSHD